MSPHWQGFWLSLVTAVLWGILPVFLKLCLQVMDSSTITWYRFAFAGLFVFAILFRTRALPAFHKLHSKTLLVTVLAAVALVLNYVANVEGLDYVDAETVQIVMQLAPFLLMFGGVVLFKEQFTRIELAGAITLFIGLVLFFSQRMALLFESINDYSYGVILIVFAAVTWTMYALAQKLLLRSLTAKQLTLIIYFLGVVILSPFVDLKALQHMNGLQLAALLFCCLNTVIAYGAFTEALNLWNASKVSAVIALAPIFTFASMEFALFVWPTHFVASELNMWSYIGAAIVVIGSITASLGKSR